MKLRLVMILLFSLLFTSQILAQDPGTSSAGAAADLRARLAENQAREADLRARLAMLEEALQPQNIERALAGVGSTRPEELREQRRRELTIERDGVRRQLDLLATNRSRLESAILDADNRAYHQSAKGFPTNQLNAIVANPRRIVIASVTSLGLLAIGVLIAFTFIRRR